MNPENTNQEPDLASLFGQESQKRRMADQAVNSAIPDYQRAIANFRIMDIKGYLIHPETDEYYSFYHGINTIPSTEQIAKFKESGIEFTTKKPASIHIHMKKILKTN